MDYSNFPCDKNISLHEYNDMLFFSAIVLLRSWGPYERRGQAKHPQDARPCDPPRAQSRCRERHGAARPPERVQERKPVAVPSARRGTVHRTGEEAGAPGVTRTPGQRFRNLKRTIFRTFPPE